tara:strand:- start:521 stop:808 length:288 start_codon:yes stop_codon:yes gene_type:complete
MSKLTKELANLAEMLINMQKDLGLYDLNPTEAHVLLMVVREHELKGKCSMLQAVEVSKKSRSTVYKAIRKLVQAGIIKIQNSKSDKRSFLVVPKI